ncbi:MAG: arginine--tRNA ligase, partial [Anaerovoracaceae bacterium]
MMNYKNEIAEILHEVIEEMAGEASLSFNEVYELIEIPSDEEMGDYALPCFRLGKSLRKAPPIIAKEISETLIEKKYELFMEVTAVKAYINIKLETKKFIEKVINEVLEEKEYYGHSEIGNGKKVIVEYSSPNIAKPFHIGHI